MPHWVELVITIFCSVMASSGFWAFIQKKNESKDLTTRMVLGIGHDLIVQRGMFYLDRGNWITEDEYENLVDYLYAPYAGLGGNGSAERVITAVKQLKIVKVPPNE